MWRFWYEGCVSIAAVDWYKSLSRGTTRFGQCTLFKARWVYSWEREREICFLPSLSSSASLEFILKISALKRRSSSKLIQRYGIDCQGFTFFSKACVCDATKCLSANLWYSYLICCGPSLCWPYFGFLPRYISGIFIVIFSITMVKIPMQDHGDSVRKQISSSGPFSNQAHRTEWSGKKRNASISRISGW